MHFARNFLRRAPAALSFVLLVLAALPRAGEARETVVEDSPGRLVVEVTVPAYEVRAGKGGSRIVAPGFGGASGTGAPDLPWHHFQVATGNRVPSVTIEPLEWTDVEVPGGLAGVPFWVTNRVPEARKDAALFAAARRLAPVVSAPDTYRGMILRRVSLPLGTYVDGEGRARMLRRFRVRVDFPNPGASPSRDARKWLRQADVLNPEGGAYLVTMPRPAPLRKAAAGASFDPGAPWLKIRVGNRVVDDHAEDGVYALTYEAAAAKGLPAAVQVGRLRLYAGPKDTATLTLRGPVEPTLREIPIEVRDATGNGIFDAGDTILFYGHGTSIWIPIPGATEPIRWMFKSDPWSFHNHYFLQWSGAEGGALRLGEAPAGATADTVDAAPHYLRAERDLATGTCDPSGAFDDEAGMFRYWYGRYKCDGGNLPPVVYPASQLRSPSWPSDTLPGRANDTTWIGFFTYSYAGNNSTNEFTPRYDGNAIPYVTLPIRGAWYRKTSGYGANRPLFDSVTWTGTYLYFEGYTVRYQRSLAWSDGRFVFPAAEGQRVAYRVTGVPAGGRVLRVEDGVGTAWLPLQGAGPALAFSDSVAPGADVQYHFTRQPLALAAEALVLEEPPTGERVVRNLRDGSIGGTRRDPDYLIIAPAALLPEADELAKYRDASENPAQPIALRPAVVRVEDIYREWSGGRLSPVAIRDFIHWARDRWGAGDGPGELKYVLLFGDGHYDYRDFRSGGIGMASPNHIPPFLSNMNSSDPAATDDLYGVVDSAKNWKSSLIDLAVGRLPLQNREQARDYLAKIARYEDPASAGAWRSRMLLTGDDATQRRRPNGEDPITDHVEQVESVGNLMLQGDSGLRKETVYLFDYPHNASYLKPEATQALLSKLNQGMRFFVFYGHGAYNQLADEVFLKTNDGLVRLKNGDKFFGMLIFSCTVGRFDKLADEGMVEQFIRQRNNGAIFGVAGTRETFSTQNGHLGNNFARKLFEPSPDSAVIGVGEVLRRAKNLALYEDHRKYVLLGEPVLVVERPKLDISVEARPDSLRAQGCDILRGRVSGGSGRGSINLRIVSGDVPKTYIVPRVSSAWDTIHTTARGQILFERTVPYVDSAFEIQYFLPKQVPFGDTAAKMQLFAWDSVEMREKTLLISGLPISGEIAENTCLVDDRRGPRVVVTGCNSREAGEVDFPDRMRISLPYCLQVSVSDSGGGVLAGEGPDQGVTMEVVGALPPFRPQATVDDLYLKTYQVQLSPQEIAEGTFLFKVSARDGFGNLTQRQITLQVAQDTALRFVRAFNSPNPLKRGETTFWFSTALPVEEGGDLTAPNQDRVRFHVRIFNQAGRMVQEFRDARSGETRWDGRDAWGRQLANGVYFYEVTASWSEQDGGPAGGRSVSRRNTLVISR